MKNAPAGFVPYADNENYTKQMLASAASAFEHRVRMNKRRQDAHEKMIEFARQLPELSNEDKYWKMLIIDAITDRHNEQKWSTKAFGELQ